MCTICLFYELKVIIRSSGNMTAHREKGRFRDGISCNSCEEKGKPDVRERNDTYNDIFNKELPLESRKSPKRGELSGFFYSRNENVPARDVLKKFDVRFCHMQNTLLRIPRLWKFRLRINASYVNISRALFSESFHAPLTAR